MRANLGFSVLARSAGTVCAILAILMPTLAALQPARAQGAPSPVLNCVTEVTGQDAAGKTLITIPARFVATRPDGGLIIAVDPSCLAKPVTVDKYADAKATVDDVVNKAKKAGVPPKVADRAGAALNEDIDAAKKTGDDPANQVAGGNNARVQKSAEDPDNGDDAMVAAIAGVAGVCMVASAGICAAAVAAVLPSILPAKISSKDVQGIASVLNDVNQGKPVSPERIKTSIDTARKFGKASEPDLAAFGKLAETGLKVAAAEKDLVERGLKPDAAQKVIALINKAIIDGHFDCGEVFKAANIPGPIQVSETFVAKIVATVANSRHGASLSPAVRACLILYFDPNR